MKTNEKLKFLSLPETPFRKLYKYISKVGRELESIKDGKIFCTRMKCLNDIFDGTFFLNKTNLFNVANENNYLILNVITVLYLNKYDILEYTSHPRTNHPIFLSTPY